MGAPAKSPLLDPEVRDILVAAIGTALRNNASFEVTDASGRWWFVAPDVVDNQSVVLVRVSRGTETQVRNLSTATLVPEVATAAVNDLAGALK